MPPIPRLAALILAVAAIYFLAGRLGLLLAFDYKNVSPVWPPSGVAVCLLLLLGRRVWPGVALGALLVNYSTSLPLQTSALIAVGNTCEAVACAALFGLFGSSRCALGRPADVLLLAASAMASTTIAATVGSASLLAAGFVSGAEFGPALLTWWLGDWTGILIFGSVLLIWLTPPEARDSGVWRGVPWRWVEIGALAATVVVMTRLVFGPASEYRYAVFPPLIWAALRFGQRGAAACLLLVTAIAVWATIHGAGPFVRADTGQSLLYLQTFMAVLSSTVLLMGAAITERAETEAAFESAESRFRLALNDSDIVVFRQDQDLRYTWIYDGRGRFRPDAVRGKTDAELAGADEAATLTAIKRRVIESGSAERREVVATTQGRTSAYDLLVEPVRDARGQVVGVTGVAADITDIKRYQADIENLNARLRRAMRETHHRVKNNLQVIAAMVDMSLLDDQESVPAAELRRLAGVTRTLAAVHDILTFEAPDAEDVATLSVSAIVEKLKPMLEATTMGRALHFDVDEVRLSPRQGTSLAVIASELVSNAVKHGAGSIQVRVKRSGDACALEVADDGEGFPEGFDVASAAGTGLELVQNLSTWDLGGTLECGNGPNGGGRIVVTFTAGDQADSRGEAIVRTGAAASEFDANGQEGSVGGEGHSMAVLPQPETRKR